jgi:hypothetical protein
LRSTCLPLLRISKSLDNTATLASENPPNSKDHVFWVGEFSGTFFNDKGANSLFDHSGVRCPGSYDLNFGKNEGHANGYCVIMGEGSPSDQAFIKWSCDGDTVDCFGTQRDASEIRVSGTSLINITGAQYRKSESISIVAVEWHSLGI